MKQAKAVGSGEDCGTSELSDLPKEAGAWLLPTVAIPRHSFGVKRLSYFIHRSRKSKFLCEIFHYLNLGVLTTCLIFCILMLGSC